MIVQAMAVRFRGCVLWTSPAMLCFLVMLCTLGGSQARHPPARVARGLVHKADWVALATIQHSNGSSSNLVTPRSSVFSMSDGTVDNSSGVPYFYVTAFDPAIKDLLVDPVASLSISLAETNYCRQHGFDPQSPLCVRVELAGIIGKVFGSEEEIAKKALFSRHPEMKTWPSSHGYFVAKMNISSISLLDHFGGAVHVDVQDYFHSSS
uniref:protein CREG1-like n=1 Tax=Myxine glutinosa TaxID=7769 RepID=UPI00358F6101